MFKRFIALVCAACLSGCASGKIDTVWPFLTEPGSAGRVGASPLREHQVDLRELLVSEFSVRGVRVAHDGSPAPGTDAVTTTLGANAGSTRRVLVVARDARTSLDQMVAAVDEVDRRQELRNDVAASLVAASTANCNVYLQAVRSGQVTSRLASDFFAGAFATAASLAAPPRSADILAGLSALSTAAGSSVDRNIFAEQGAELVAEAIIQIRNERRALIEGKLSRPYETYTLGMTLADLYEFHGDCSMLRGFGRLREAVIAREQSVRAVRAAAMEVQRSGGSAVEVVAVLAGLAPVVDPGPPPPESGAKDTDLVALRSAGAACIDAAIISFSRGSEAVPGSLSAAPLEAVCGDRPGWPGRYRRAAREAFSDHAAAIHAASATLRAATPETGPAAEATLTAALGQVSATYAAKANAQVVSNLAARVLLLRLLTDWPADRPATELASAIRGLAGTELLPEAVGQADPAFALALNAAADMMRQSSTSSSTAVADHARRAAVSYMETLNTASAPAPQS